MLKNENHVSASNLIILVLVLVNAVILKIGFTKNENLYIALIFTMPLLFLAIYDVKQKRHAILRNYPVIGRRKKGYKNRWSVIRKMTKSIDAKNADNFASEY